ncbi:MAG: effector-associated domain EAD1-containing protein [Caldilineaceae bacterium]
MRKSQTRRSLRTYLAQLFDDPATIKVLVSDAGLDPVTINFNGSVVAIWQNVLIEAEVQRKLEPLIAQAGQWFPNHAAALNQRYVAYSAADPDLPSPKQWVWAVGTVLSLALVAFGGWQYWTYIKPMPSSGSFNIAVSQVPIMTRNGKRTENCVSKKISQWIYADVIAPTDVTAQELLTDSRGPAAIGVIFAADPAARHAKVATIAEQIHATILVYGVIYADGNQYEFLPEFYVNPAENAFSYASEIAGANRLGEAVSFTLPPGITCEQINVRELQQSNLRLVDERVRALTIVVSGLRNLYAGEFDLAYARFAQGTRLSSALAPDHSQAVFQLLMGASKLRAFEPTDAASTADNNRNLARQAFSHTVQLDPGYSRGYLGLGYLALAEAQLYDQLGNPMPAINPERLLTASQWFTAALTATDKPVGAYIVEKAGLGMGTAHLLGFIYGIPTWSEEKAVAEFQNIITQYEKTRSPSFIMLAAQAQERLAHLAEFHADWSGMAERCQAAIDLLTEPTMMADNKWIARHWACVALAKEMQGDLCQAVNDYALAQHYGAGLLRAQELTTWQQHSERLQRSLQGASCNEP